MHITSETRIEQTQEHWDLDISPKRNLLDLRLGDLWRARDLVMLFVWRDFVSVYKQTILGPLWYIIQPLLTTVVFTFIFGSVAKLPTDGLPQFLFYMSGTVVWSYFSACITKTSDTFITNTQLFGKVYFPRLAVPVSILISSLITFAIQFALFPGFHGLFCAAGQPAAPQLVDPDDAGVGLDDGRAGIGVWHHHLLADHQVPRPALFGHFRRDLADVCHAGDPADLFLPAALPLDHPGQPDDAHRGNLPVMPSWAAAERSTCPTWPIVLALWWWWSSLGR